MKKLSLFGRFLFALPFGLIGLNHFLMTDLFLGMMSSFIPGGAYTVLATGALLMAASVSIMLNKFIYISCLGLAGLLLVFILSIHIPGLYSPDANHANIALIQLLKDTALMGGAILLAAYMKEGDA